MDTDPVRYTRTSDHGHGVQFGQVSKKKRQEAPPVADYSARRKLVLADQALIVSFATKPILPRRLHVHALTQSAHHPQGVVIVFAKRLGGISDTRAFLLFFTGSAPLGAASPG